MTRMFTTHGNRVSVWSSAIRMRERFFITFSFQRISSVLLPTTGTLAMGLPPVRGLNDGYLAPYCFNGHL
jgi:hypothetical protein